MAKVVTRIVTVPDPVLCTDLWGEPFRPLSGLYEVVRKVLDDPQWGTRGELLETRLSLREKLEALKQPGAKVELSDRSHVLLFGCIENPTQQWAPNEDLLIVTAMRAMRDAEVVVTETPPADRKINTAQAGALENVQ